MRYNQLGKTDRTISEVGLGAWELGSLKSKEAAFAILDTAFEHGVTFIDTSDNYGKSELYIGQWLKARRPTGVTVATKASCGPSWEPAAIRTAIERSLTRLQVDTIDILKLHNPGLEHGKRDDLYGELTRAQTEGKIRWVGISEDAPQAQACLEAQPYEILQVDYSMLTLQPEVSLFAYTRTKQIGLIARMVFGRFVFERKIKYRWEQPMKDRAESMCLVDWFLKHADYSRPELLLRYVLSNPDVNCALVGTASVDHLTTNIALAEKGSLSEDILADFRSWVQKHPA
jgi:aryl-alcohol dehydrogenase-like predicted oxidoreductase